MSCEIINFELFINGRRIETPSLVDQALCISDDLYAVLLKKSNQSSNLIAVNSKGNILWTADGSGYKGEEQDPYVQILIENGKLNAQSWFGLTNEIDLQSGESNSVSFDRF